MYFMRMTLKKLLNVTKGVLSNFDIFSLNKLGMGNPYTFVKKLNNNLAFIQLNSRDLNCYDCYFIGREEGSEFHFHEFYFQINFIL